MSKWISIKDRLPDKEGEYLTAKKVVGDFVAYKIMPFGKVGNEMAFYSGYPRGVFRFRVDVDIDAWMPIEPYTGVEDKTERVYRVHSKPDKVFKTQAERDAYIYGYGDGHEDGCSDGRAQALEIIDKTDAKSDHTSAFDFGITHACSVIREAVLALKGEQG